MARSMLSAGMVTSRALVIARRRRKLAVASPPPSLAATAISRAILVKMAPFLASVAAFLCLIVDHLGCPDMHPSLRSGGAPTAPDAGISTLAHLPDVPLRGAIDGLRILNHSAVEL